MRKGKKFSMTSNIDKIITLMKNAEDELGGMYHLRIEIYTDRSGSFEISGPDNWKHREHPLWNFNQDSDFVDLDNAEGELLHLLKEIKKWNIKESLRIAEYNAKMKPIHDTMKFLEEAYRKRGII